MDLLLFDEAGLDYDDILLMQALQRNGPTIREQYGPFDLASLNDLECKQNFRFHKEDIPRLANALHMPNLFTTKSHVKASGLEGLCLLLRRLAYPNRLSDLTPLFGRSKFDLCHIFNMALDHICDNYSHLLRTMNQDWITQGIDNFALAIHQKGAPLTNCWGFIDGTVRPICRPTHDQNLAYNGHKRTHAIKFQAIMAPNGLIANVAGPFEGKRHDSFLLEESGIVGEIRRFHNNNGEQMCVYGDPAYPLSPWLITPFRGHNLTPEQQQFNTDMSAVRQCVEWGFGKVITNFAFLDYKKNLKLFLQPVGKYYLVGCILTNCHTCLYGSQTGTYFGLHAPNLDIYLP